MAERNNGKQIENRSREAAAQVFHPNNSEVHALRKAAGCVSQVRDVSHLFPEVGRSGLHSGCPQGQLVGTKSYDDRPHCRHAYPHSECRPH